MDENLIKEGRMLRRRRFFCDDVIFSSQKRDFRSQICKKSAKMG